ncbi:uncharacterized protein LOC143145554 isoform X2 [Ptiloglossa arizonensis]|uniref:uncharacterized protein LOC143145554 isoform X2 n=1 Tax=Ptiloglossa arizonensis TaxID=3350558 RepID=UPI003FA1256F
MMNTERSKSFCFLPSLVRKNHTWCLRNAIKRVEASSNWNRSGHHVFMLKSSQDGEIEIIATEQEN